MNIAACSQIAAPDLTADRAHSNACTGLTNGLTTFTSPYVLRFLYSLGIGGFSFAFCTRAC